MVRQRKNNFKKPLTTPSRQVTNRQRGKHMKKYLNPNIGAFLAQVLPGRVAEQMRQRGIASTVASDDVLIQDGELVKAPTSRVKAAFNRYGVTPETKALVGEFDYEMLIEEISKESGISEEALLRAFTMDMHLLTPKFLEAILGALDADFTNWYDAREFDNEYEG